MEDERQKKIDQDQLNRQSTIPWFLNCMKVEYIEYRVYIIK